MERGKNYVKLGLAPPERWLGQGGQPRSAAVVDDGHRAAALGGQGHQLVPCLLEEGAEIAQHYLAQLNSDALPRKKLAKSA